MPPKYRVAGRPAASLPQRAAGAPDPKSSWDVERRDPRSTLEALKTDPSLTLTESGRDLLRWLHQHTVEPEDCEQLVDAVPTHSTNVVAGLARMCAKAWRDFAKKLEHRADTDGETTA